jgi:quercetin dioxygenase-like cupin family protein
MDLIAGQLIRSYELIIRRADQEAVDRYPKVPRYAIVNVELGSSSLHVGDLTFLPGSSVPYHYHDAGSEETQILLSGVLECWIDGKRTIVRGGDTVTAPPGIRHAFHNRTDTPARMVTAFPRTLPETVHVDDPELEDVAEHPAIIRAGTRIAPYMAGVDGVERVELSGEFSGAKSTYSYMVVIQPGAAVPVRRHDHDTALFVVEGPLSADLGDEEGVVLGESDGAVVGPGEGYDLRNEGDSVARVIIIHPVLHPE